MNSGIKIRNSSLAAAAIISALVQNIVTMIIEKNLSQLPGNKSIINSISSVMLYVVSYIISVIFLQKLARIKWLRVHFFGEKIVEGKWFEVIYEDLDHTIPFSYGIVDTYFDSSGEFIYEGIDYDLDKFSITGKFSSTCTSLKYHSNGNTASLDYAYEFENRDIHQSGYGCIDFFMGKNQSDKHYGKFFNSDGKVYYFKAKLINDKSLIQQLNNTSIGFVNAFNRLIDDFAISHPDQREVISEQYQKRPEQFDEFCRYEDSDRNLKKYLLDNFDFKGKTVLDIGAGTGRFTGYIADDAAQLICTDSSIKMLEYLKQKNRAYENKTTYYNCEHTALNVFVRQKVDYIIAGFTFGAYFNNEYLSDTERRNMFDYLIGICRSLLKQGGTLIITESAGLDGSLLSFDKNLKDYFSLLQENGFSNEYIYTGFRFKNETEAKKVIGGFWGNEGIKKIEIQGDEYILKETSGVWVKTF